MPGDDELDQVIEREAASPAEGRDSRTLAKALRERREALSGGGAVPIEDKNLSERILTEARSRSAEISARRSGGGQPQTKPDGRIPWWLWSLWVLALVAAYVGWKLLG
jgi:hypothetical protein